MAARLFLINVIVGGGSQLDVTFELAPGSDDVPTADILWTIICENGDDEGSFPVANAETRTKLAMRVTATTVEAGSTYVTSLGTNDCNPAANEQHTILFQAGTGGQTFEILNYGGDVSTGAVVI